MSKNPLNVLFLCSWYPSKEHRTLGNFIQRHAQALALHHKVTVLAAVDSSSDSYEVLNEKGVEEHIVYFKKKWPLLSYRKALLKAYKKLNRENNYDILHIHVAYPAAVILPSINTPYFITEHFSGYHKISGFRWGYLKRTLTLRALKNAQGILPVSHFLAKAISEFGAENEFYKVPNVVNTKVFSYQETPKPSRFTFLHVSSLEERSKNISGLLAGFDLLNQRGVDFQLIIGGDGNVDELQAKVSKTQIPSNKIHVFGESPLVEIAQKMQQAHSLVMFSHFETQSCTILEALCCGTPVVSSRVGGIPEEINSSNGILVEPNDIESLANGLERMITHYNQYNPRAIAHNAMALYANESVAQQMSTIYISNEQNRDS